MALAEVHTSRNQGGIAKEPGDRILSSPFRYCAIAIHALESALETIACADIEARCKAVSTATEAMTSLFLEFEGVSQEYSTQGAGQLYETIMTRLLSINLYNNSEMAHEAISMIEQLRDACARWNGANVSSRKTAQHRADP